MTFEYRDDTSCDKLVAQPDTDDDRKPVVFLSTTGLNKGVYVPVARVEEVVAGIRDAARTAAGRPARPLTHAAAADAVAWAIAHEKAAARQTTGQADTWPLATPCTYCSHTLNWHVTGGRCRVTAGEASCGCTAFVAPDGSHPDTAPAVGQPAECPTPETHNWGCGCPTDRWPAAKARETLAGYLGSKGNDPSLALMLNDYHQAVAAQAVAETRAAVGQPAEAHDTDRAAAYQDVARRANRRLAAVERLISGRPGYHQITVKELLTAMSDETVENER